MRDACLARPVETAREFDRALAILRTLFVDPADLETDDKFRRCFREPETARYHLIEIDGACAGMSLLRIHPAVPGVVYIPYMGILPRYRGRFTASTWPRILQAQMRDLDAHKVLIDAEDPARIGSVYPDEDPARLVRRTETRLRLFQRYLGMDFVDDPDLPYCRPSSHDPLTSQDYDLLGVCFRDAAGPTSRDAYNADRTAIRASAYVESYVELIQLEYGTAAGVPDVAALRAAYPAVDRFFRRVEAHPGKEWVRLAPRRRAASARR